MKKLFVNYWYLFLIDFIIWCFALAVFFGCQTSTFAEWAINTNFTIGLKEYNAHDLWVYFSFTGVGFTCCLIVVEIEWLITKTLIDKYKVIKNESNQKDSEESSSVD